MAAPFTPNLSVEQEAALVQELNVHFNEMQVKAQLRALDFIYAAAVAEAIVQDGA